uniref:phospholipase D n=1 Tax=Quercus lobata TaxID=97700 RepID=A0A7N2RDQ2_QUELO
MAERSSDSQVYLHGDLHVKIIKGRSMHSAFNNPPAPIVTVRLGKLNLDSTRVLFCSKTDMPPSTSGQPLQIPLAHQLPNSDSIHFDLKHNKITVGTAFVPIQRILTGETILEWFPILDSGSEPESQGGVAILIEMTFNNCEYSPLYRYGIASDPENFGLQNTDFPVLKSGSVTLYQDAHVPDGMLPKIELDGGKVFEQKKCWVDICHAILEAKQMVYIVGWSIYHKVKLVREQTRRPLPNGVTNYNLGNLLKYKAEQGVPVLVIVWSNPVNAFLYSHHQKFVVVDTRAYENSRKTTAFVGGLDLCDGRYDTPEHRLFRDRDTVFKNDYLNPTLLLWNKFGKPSDFKQGSKMAQFLIHVVTRFLDMPLLSHSQSIPEDDPTFWTYKEDDPENWHIQVFRSIDSESLKTHPARTTDQNLIIEKSIQSAYIQAIRSAQHFIYIENQFFIGSSYAWPSHKDAGANNLIPMELALKIASKIRAKERFAVYIVIPMQPDGHLFTEQILFWQGQTMQMMYDIIAQELKSINIENSHPEDYLNFYCLGNREELPKEVSVPPDQSSQNRLIYGYRMSLWAEHLGTLPDCFKEPKDLDCVKSVNKIAVDNLSKYKAKDFTPLQGHLLKFPILVNANGKIEVLPGKEPFPVEVIYALTT